MHGWFWDIFSNVGHGNDGQSRILHFEHLIELSWTRWIWMSAMKMGKQKQLSFFIWFFFSPPSSIDVLSECSSRVFIIIIISLCARVSTNVSNIWREKWRKQKPNCGSIGCLKSSWRSLDAVPPHWCSICRRSRVFWCTSGTVTLPLSLFYYPCLNLTVLGIGQLNDIWQIPLFLFNGNASLK